MSDSNNLRIHDPDFNCHVTYVDLGRQAREIKDELCAAFERTLLSGHYILGPEGQAFEEEFARYCGTKFAIGVASGTDALYLILKALGIGAGDEVITVPNTFIATASAIALTGATPVFVDIGDDMNMDPVGIESAITSRTRAILPVHMTGRVAKMLEITRIAEQHSLLVIEDAAQAVSAGRGGKRAGSWGVAAGFSLHPLKNLHAIGDAGAITTDDSSLRDKLLTLRNLGLKTRDQCVGWNFHSRLDELQAAILKVQLKHLDRWTSERRELAQRYNTLLDQYVHVPEENDDEFCTWQTYMIRCDSRDELAEHLNSNGVGVSVHYPTPIHLQPCAKELGYSDEDFPIARQIASQILSLPLFPGMTEAEQNRVIELIRRFHESRIQLPSRTVSEGRSHFRRA